MKTDADNAKEFDEWQKEGKIALPVIKRCTNKELMEIAVEEAKKTGEYAKAEKILDYFLPEDSEIVTITDYRFDFHATADFGGSEGIYLDCYLQGIFDDTNNKRCEMGTFKTLKTDLESMKTMAELGGILNFFLTGFVNKNLDRFIPDAARKVQAIQKLEKENE